MNNPNLVLYIYITLILCLIYVITDAIIRIRKEYKEYMTSGFYNNTKQKFLSVLFSNKKIRQYFTYCTLEKICLNGHLLCNVEIPTKNGQTEVIDLVMIDKYGISIFLNEYEKGIFSGKENDFYWKVKKGLFSFKTINMAREANRKIEAIKEMLRISDTSIVNAYILLEKNAKYNNVRLHSSHIRLVKSFYMKGVITYEINNSRRALLENEVKAYTILLEKRTKISRGDITERILSLADDDKKKFRLEFKPIVGSYLDLKQIWYILCQCDKDYNPPLSWYRHDIDDFGELERMKLIPNVFYKHIINNPFIIVRYGKDVVGFLAFETNRVIEPLKELGKVNYVNAVCIDKSFLREGLKEDLYDFLENKLPKEYVAPGIVTKVCDIAHSDNYIMKKRRYVKEAILMDNGTDNNTIYYYKSIKD